MISHDPYLNLTKILWRWSFWASLIKIGPKLWPLRVFTRFFDDLTYCPCFWPIFELDRDIVMMIILSKFDEDWTKTVASRVFTSQRMTHDAQTHDSQRQTETSNISSPWALRSGELKMATVKNPNLHSFTNHFFSFVYLLVLIKITYFTLWLYFDLIWIRKYGFWIWIWILWLNVIKCGKLLLDQLVLHKTPHWWSNY